MAEDAREGGATTLPAPKKRLEGALVAVVTRMWISGVRLGVTATADMLQRGVGIRRVLVRAFFETALGFVELDTDVVSLHVRSGNTADPNSVGLLLLVPSAGVAPAASTTSTAVVLGGTAGTLGTFLERVLLR